MKRTVLLLITGLILYIPIFAPKIRPEPAIMPRWAANTDNSGSAREKNAAPLPFRLGDSFGYIESDGTLTYRDEVLYNVAAASSGFINYSSIGANLVVQDNAGVVIERLDTRGYPAVSKNRLFVFATNRTGISEWTFAGENLWNREYSAIITSFDGAENLTMVGLLDGRLEIVDENGELEFSHAFSGSRYDGVYGCSFGSDERTFAVIHGLAPQYLSVFTRGDSQYERIARFVLDEELNSRRLVGFFADDRRVFVEAEREVLIYGVPDGEAGTVPHRGAIVDFGVSRADSILWLLSAEDDGAEIVAVHENGKGLLRAGVESTTVYLDVRDEYVLTGAGSLIARIEIEAQ